MGLTTTSVLPPPVQAAFDMKLLARPSPYLIHNKFSTKKSLASRNGNQIRMRRYNRLTPVTTPLGPSGTTPPAQQLTALDMSAQIQWYGTWIGITDQVTLINQDPVLNEQASVLSQCLRESEDLLTRNLLDSTASTIACTHGVNGDNPSELSRRDIDEVYRTLFGADARKISRVIEGENKFSTAAIRESYFAMMHSDLITDLESVNGFISVGNYPSQQPILSAEIGNVGNVRFLASSQGAVERNASALGNDVYKVFVTGEESYTCIDLEDANAQFIYQPLGHGDDPLMQRQTAGFKFAYASRITNDAWNIALRTTLST